MNPSSTTFHELDQRRNDGMEVTMFWEPGSRPGDRRRSTTPRAAACEIRGGPRREGNGRLNHPSRTPRSADRKRPPVLVGPDEHPGRDGLDGRYPVTPGTPPRDVVVRVRHAGMDERSSSTSSIRTAAPAGLRRGALPTAVFERRFDRIYSEGVPAGTVRATASARASAALAPHRRRIDRTGANDLRGSGGREASTDASHVRRDRPVHRTLRLGGVEMMSVAMVNRPISPLSCDNKPGELGPARRAGRLDGRAPARAGRVHR